MARRTVNQTRVRAAIAVTFLTLPVGLSAANAQGAGGSPSDPGNKPPAPPANVHAGDRVTDHGAAVIAGPPGTGVGAEVIFADGTMQSVEVRTMADGSVQVEEWGDDEQDAQYEEGAGAPSSDAGGAAPSGSTSECNDDAYNVDKWKWTTTYKWYYNSRNTPSNLNSGNTEAVLKDAAANITGADNSCSLADNVDASHNEQGTTSKGTDISADNVCAQPGQTDSTSVVSFGDLKTGSLGYSCWYFNSSTLAASEVDIKLNKVDYNWYLPGTNCNSEWNVEAVATHEFGHAFGMAHVSEDNHPNLTMSTKTNGTCQNQESKLGKGDVKGLEAKY